MVLCVQPFITSLSLFLCSTGGIQTTNEWRPILHTASPPPRDPGLPLHPRRTALPSRGGYSQSLQASLQSQCVGLSSSIHYVTVILLQVMFAMRELSGPLSLLIEMVTYSSYCNESFSLGVLQLLKVKGKGGMSQSWQT